MSFLAQFFAKRSSAPIARDRLQILLAHERSGGEGHSELIAKLREEILEVIARHVPIDRDKVQIKLDRGAAVSTLEIDIEVPGLKEQALKDKASRNGTDSPGAKNLASEKVGATKAGDPKAGDPKAGDPKVGESKSGDIRPADAKPADTKAGNTKAGDAKLDPASGTRSLPTGP